MRARGLPLLLIGVAFGAPALAQTEPPRSAIDWLSDTFEASQPPPGTPQDGGLVLDDIRVTPLDQPSADRVGTLPRAVTGLPRGLWSGSTTDALARKINAVPTGALPAVQENLAMLMQAALDPPLDAGPEGRFFTTRVDSLLTMGALHEAQDLLDAVAASPSPETFRRAFDVDLLLGEEDRGCELLQTAPGLAPSFSVRIFCLARTGDWAAAALTLDTAKALGAIEPQEDALLASFLDPDLADLLPPPPADATPSPLTFRMLEAIGEAQPTTGLPVAYAHSDLRPISGWKARVQAAERLARAGAIPPERLWAIYLEREPAASGQPWDRVRALQAFISAVEADAPARIADTLPAAWSAMQEARLEVPFADGFGAVVTDLGLEGEAANLALTIGLLSEVYESVALAPPRPEGISPPELLRAIALGRPAPPFTGSALEEAIATAFEDTRVADLPPVYQSRIDTGRLGEALLVALAALAPGRGADPEDIRVALTFLRQIGMEDTARRAALQILLLDRST